MDFIPADLISAFNQSDMKITLINGSIISLVGSDNAAQRVVGMSARGIVISEAALADPVSISYLRPITNASNGFFITISTPRGRNRFWELFNVAKSSKDYYCSYLTVEDTRHIPLERIEQDVRDGIISRELSNQEYFCSWSSVNDGGYFGRYVDKMRLEDRITDIPYEPSLETYVFFDLGMDDATALIFAQFAGPVIRIIDYYENNSEGIEHYIKVIRDKDYGIVNVYLPHDAMVRELSTNTTRADKFRSLGVDPYIVPRTEISSGIESIRTVLPKTFVDAQKCDFLIKALENYSREYDEKTQTYHDRPRRSRWNHGVDAFRYLAVSHKNIGPETSAEELNARYNRVMYGNSNNHFNPLR